MAIERKTRTGVVVGDKMEKTVVVAVETHRRHPLYQKTIRNTLKYKVHDEKKECRVGDVVKIVETRPISKEKRWRVAQIISKGEVIEIKPKEIDANLVSPPPAPKEEKAEATAAVKTEEATQEKTE